MPRQPIILVPPDAQPSGDLAAGDWRLAGLSHDASAWLSVTADENAVAAVAQTLRKAGRAVRAVTLALPSRWCLAATIPTTGIARGDEKAMLYRLEERLPLPAEALVADFAFSPASPVALGVGVRIDRVKSIVDELQAAGVVVESIVPLALLMAAGVLPPRQRAAAQTSRLLAVSSGMPDGIDLVAMQGGVPIAWSHALNPADLGRRAKWIESKVDQSLAMETLGVDLGEVPAVRHAQASAAAAVAGAIVMRAGRANAVDLRRDELAPADRLHTYRGGLRTLVAAATLFFAAIAGTALLRAAAHDRAAADLEETTVVEMRSSYPAEFGATPDADIQTLLAQERRSWANAAAGSAVAAPASPGGSAPAGQSALRTIREVLRLLPADAEIRVDRSTFDETSFEITGKARSYEDLDKLASAIRAVHPEVTLPQAARGSDGVWNFTMKGTTTAASAAR